MSQGLGGPELVSPASFILKVTASCNLNCPYCYMFNLRDQTFLGRPAVMPDEILAAAAERIGEHASQYDLPEIGVTFHGGEPLLAPASWFERAAALFRRHAGPRPVVLGVQTNGVLLDRRWLDLFADLGITVSVSVDGLPAAHNRTRVNHAGRGTYRETERGLMALLGHPRRSTLFGGVLCVIDPAQNGVDIYRHFRQLGVDRMDFLWPLAHNWETPPATSGEYARYLIPIFDAWRKENHPDVLVRFFFDIIKLLLGGRQHIDALGGDPVNLAVIETDGSLEPLDALRACAHGLTLTGLNISTHPVSALMDNALYQVAVSGQAGLPSETCGRCELRTVCGGGYLPNRYHPVTGFNNPSVYCLDLQQVILHIARQMNQDLDHLMTA